MSTVFREPGTDLLQAVKEYFVSCKIWENINSQVFDGFQQNGIIEIEIIYHAFG